MITCSSTVTVERPPGDVFRYIVEPDRQAQWSDVPMRRLTDGPVGVGSRFQLTLGRGPLRAPITLEVAALEPDRRFAFTTVSTGPVLWDGEYQVQPTGFAASLLSQTGRLRFRGLWRLVEPIVGAEIRRGEIKELERLKAAAEADRS